MRVEGKVGLVYGGASGIGQGCAEVLSAEGASVVVADISEERGAEVVAAINDAGGSASFVACDFVDEDQVKAAVDATVAEHGRLDTVVTSVGAFAGGEGKWHKHLDLFLKGPYYAARHALPVMAEQGGGSLTLIGSIASLRGSNVAPTIEESAYAVSKHGVYGLAKTLAIAYGPQGIRVNCLCPGYIKTPATKRMWDAPDADRFLAESLRVPLGRWGEPEDIGRAAAFLASDAASFISGQSIVVDGGQLAR